MHVFLIVTSDVKLYSYLQFNLHYTTKLYFVHIFVRVVGCIVFSVKGHSDVRSAFLLGVLNDSQVLLQIYNYGVPVSM